MRIIIDILKADEPRVQNGFNKRFNYSQNHLVEKDKDGEVTKTETEDEFLERQIVEFVFTTMTEGERPDVIQAAMSKMVKDVRKINIKVSKQ